MNFFGLRRLTFGFTAALFLLANESQLHAQGSDLKWVQECKDPNQPASAVLIGLKGNQNYFYAANGNNQIYGKLNLLPSGSGVLFTVEGGPQFFGLAVDIHSLKLFDSLAAVTSNQPFWDGTCTLI